MQNWHRGVSKSAKIKLPPLGIEPTTPAIYGLQFQLPYPFSHQGHLLNTRSLNWTGIISGSIKHDFIRVWKFETGMDWQIGWVGKAVRILIHRWLVLWVRFPVEATLFLLILKPLNVNFVQTARNVRFVFFRKNSNQSLHYRQDTKSLREFYILPREECSVFFVHPQTWHSLSYMGHHWISCIQSFQPQLSVAGNPEKRQTGLTVSKTFTANGC